MANTQEIIMEISDYLDRFMLKKSKLTGKDLISFIEDRWERAGEEKYHIHMGDIIMGRMVNEYIKLQDVENVKRWLFMTERHDLSKRNPSYINNYYIGDSLRACKANQAAMHYLTLCYQENPDYIFTRGKACRDFFCEQMNLQEEYGYEEDEKTEPVSGLWC